MACNKIQFQKGISLNEFLQQYGSEDQCFDALYSWRWPKGFECPVCGHDKRCEVSARRLQQCNRCHHQTSIIAGTIFEASKLPLTIWFQGYLSDDSGQERHLSDAVTSSVRDFVQRRLADEA